MKLSPSGIIMLCILFVSSLSSCTSEKKYLKLKYFNDLPEKTDTIMNISNVYNSSKIKIGDGLLITITTLDQLSSAAALAAPGVSSAGSTGLNVPAAATGNSFYIDSAGTVELPLIGQIKLAGLTLTEAKELLRTKFAEYYKSFSLNVSFLNHYYTFIGEVARPGTYMIQGDKVSLIDALAVAGDVTTFGKRENILLMRDTGNAQKHLVSLNLNSKAFISSPYYYLRENDVVYIQPIKAKLGTLDPNKSIRLLTALLTLTVLILNKVIK
jgi:polysaccharide export outer membrane protein